MRRPLVLIATALVMISLFPGICIAATTESNVANARALVFSQVAACGARLSGAQVGLVVYPTYDLNHDAVVNLIDLALLATNYGRSDGVYDLNQDGLVDLYDLVKMAREMFLSEAKLKAHAALSSAFAAYAENSYSIGNWIILTGHKESGDVAIDAALDMKGLAVAQSTAVARMAAVERLVTIAAVGGVVAPQTDDTPVATAIETAEYTAVVAWNLSGDVFAASTEYTATITITPKPGYSLIGVPANFFTVSGATTTSAADSGVVTAAFSVTSDKHRLCATGFRINLLNSTAVEGTLTRGRHGTLDLSSLPDSTVVVSTVFDAPDRAVIDLVSLMGEGGTPTPFERHLESLTVTMDALLGEANDRAISLETLRWFFGSSVTVVGTASHPDHLSTDVSMLIILK